MSATPPPDDAPDMTAAELALGLLEGDARAAALRRLLADRAFAAEVDRWRDRFALLHLTAPDAVVSPDLYDRIEASLDARGAAPATSSPARREWLWPALATMAGIAALFLLVLRVMPPAPPPIPVPIASPTASAPLLVAALAVEKGEGSVAALYEPTGGALRVTGAALAGAGKSQQLWVIAGDGVPHSLGLLGADATTVKVAAIDHARLTAGAVLAISIEPAGGSPTGLPTGPVVAKGTLSRV